MEISFKSRAGRSTRKTTRRKSSVQRAWGIANEDNEDQREESEEEGGGLALAWVRKLIMRGLRHSLWRAFAAWKDALSDSQRERVAMGNVLRRWRNLTAVFYFTRWRENATFAKSSRIIVDKYIRRVTKRKLFVTFTLWRVNSHDVKSRRAKLTGVTARWLRIKKWKVFNSWSHFARTRANHRKHTRRPARMMRLSKSLFGWKLFSIHQKNLRRSLTLFHNRRTRRRLFAHFCEWAASAVPGQGYRAGAGTLGTSTSGGSGRKSLLGQCWGQWRFFIGVQRGEYKLNMLTEEIVSLHERHDEYVAKSSEERERMRFNLQQALLQRQEEKNDRNLLTNYHEYSNRRTRFLSEVIQQLRDCSE